MFISDPYSMLCQCSQDLVVHTNFNYHLLNTFPIIGNHAVYNLQASDDDDKKEWIKAFEEVFESLKLCN